MLFQSHVKSGNASEPAPMDVAWTIELVNHRGPTVLLLVRRFSPNLEDTWRGIVDEVGLVSIVCFGRLTPLNRSANFSWHVISCLSPPFVAGISLACLHFRSFNSKHQINLYAKMKKKIGANYTYSDLTIRTSCRSACFRFDIPSGTEELIFRGRYRWNIYTRVRLFVSYFLASGIGKWGRNEQSSFGDKRNSWCQTLLCGLVVAFAAALSSSRRATNIPNLSIKRCNNWSRNH